MLVGSCSTTCCHLAISACSGVAPPSTRPRTMKPPNATTATSRNSTSTAIHAGTVAPSGGSIGDSVSGASSTEEDLLHLSQVERQHLQFHRQVDVSYDHVIRYY